MVTTVSKRSAAPNHSNPYLTTGEVARVCKVAPRTVSKWIDCKRLKGIRIPGSLHRRVQRDHLIQFMRAHGIPLGDLEDCSGISTVLWIGPFTAELKDAVCATHRERFRFIEARGAFDAGIAQAETRPQCVVLSEKLEPRTSQVVVSNLRKLDVGKGRSTSIFAIVAHDEEQRTFTGCAVDEFFRIPFDPALLAQRLLTRWGD